MLEQGVRIESILTPWLESILTPWSNRSMISSYEQVLVIFFSLKMARLFFLAQILPRYRNCYKKCSVLSSSLHVKSQTNFIHSAEQKQSG